MTTTSISAGYQVHIKSWENDADHRNTKIISGLTKDAAKFVKSLASLFASNGTQNKYGANLYVDWCDRDERKVNNAYKNLESAFKDIVAQNRNGVEEYFKHVGYDLECIELTGDDFQDFIGEVIYDFFGGSECYLFRVFEDIKCYYFPVEVEEVVL